MLQNTAENVAESLKFTFFIIFGNKFNNESREIFPMSLPLHKKPKTSQSNYLPWIH